MISLYGEGSQPLSYVFDNNDDLRQSDSQLRNVTLNMQQLTRRVQLMLMLEIMMCLPVTLSYMAYYTSVQWNHTSSVVQNDEIKYDIITNHTNSIFMISQLTIRNVSNSDMGDYKCRVLRTHLEKRISLNSKLLLLFCLYANVYK